MPGRGVGDGRLFGWELLLTAFFLLVMYSCVFVRPGHGDAAPLAGGVSLVAALSAGGRYTGYSPLSPARVLASSLIFNCAWRHAWVYLLAELLGAAAAVLVVLAVYGRGPHYTGETHAQNFGSGADF